MWFKGGSVPLGAKKSGGEYRRYDPEPVRLADLVIVQQRLNVENLARLLTLQEPWEPIECLEVEGLLYIVDGNHRAWIRWIQGEESINAVVWRPR